MSGNVRLKVGAAAAAPTGLPDFCYGTICNSNDRVYIAGRDLARHQLVLGASGHGKSNLLDLLWRQAVLEGKGGGIFFDPHGSEFDTFIKWTTKHRLDRYRTVRVFDLSDPNTTIGLNPFLYSSLHRGERGFEPVTLAEMVMKAFLRVWGQDNAKDTPQIYEILLNLFCSLIYCNLTLLDAGIFLDVADPKGKRAYFLTQLPDEFCMYWEEIHSLSASDVVTYFAPVKRRLMGFLKAPATRRMFACTDPKRNLDLAAAMDGGEFSIFAAKPGRTLAPTHAQLFGALLLNLIYLAGFERRRPDVPCMVILDEAANFLTPDIALILEECRKFGISLTLAIQHLEQLREAGERTVSAVLSNCNVKTCLGGLPPRDAELMAEIMNWGRFNLQTYKKKLYRPQVVGQEMVWLRQKSETQGENQSASANWSRGTSVSDATSLSNGVTNTTGQSRTEGESETEGKSVTHSHAHTDSHSRTTTETSGWADGESESSTDTSGSNSSWNDGRSATTSYDSGAWLPSGSSETSSHGSGGGSNEGRSTSRGITSTRSGSTSQAESEGTADTVSFAETDSVSKAKNRSTTDVHSRAVSHSEGHTHQVSQSESRGGSVSHGTSHARTDGQSESSRSVYEERGTETWSKDELVHLRAVSLANLRQDQLIVRVGSRRPVRATIPYVGDVSIVPGSDVRTYCRLLAQTPWIWSADQADRARAEAEQFLEDLAREGLENSRRNDMPKSIKDRFE